MKEAATALVTVLALVGISLQGAAATNLELDPSLEIDERLAPPDSPAVNVDRLVESTYEDVALTLADNGLENPSEGYAAVNIYLNGEESPSTQDEEACTGDYCVGTLITVPGRHSWRVEVAHTNCGTVGPHVQAGPGQIPLTYVDRNEIRFADDDCDAEHSFAYAWLYIDDELVDSTYEQFDPATA